MRAPVSPGREQPGAEDHPAVPGVPAAQEQQTAARLAEELACEVTHPDPELPGRYEAKWGQGVLIGTAEELRAFFPADARRG